MLHQVTLFSILFQVLPDWQAIDFFGIMVQVVGQSMVILSFTKFKSNKEIKDMQIKSNKPPNGFKEKFKQFQISLQTAVSINNNYHANANFDVFLIVFAFFLSNERYLHKDNYFFFH